MAKCPRQEGPVAGQTHYFETEALPEGEVGAEVVIKDIQSDLNIPIVVKYDRKNDEFDVVMKTIMRKKDFKTPNKVIKY